MFDNMSCVLTEEDNAELNKPKGNNNPHRSSMTMLHFSYCHPHLCAFALVLLGLKS